MFADSVQGEQSHFHHSLYEMIQVSFVILSIIAVGCFVLLNVSDSSTAIESVEKDGVYYTISDGTATVSGINESITDLIIPSSIIYNSYPYEVTCIVSSAFRYTQVISLTVPRTVTSINLPQNYSSLANITVDSSNTVYSSQNGVLFNKDKSELLIYPAAKAEVSYSIPNSVSKVDSTAFGGCTHLETVTVPASVTSIGRYAFEKCSSLSSVLLPETISTIQMHTFEGCSSLESITIPDSVKNIEDYAFRYCTSLESITIPESVLNIGTEVFYYTTSLVSIDVDPDNTAFSSEDGVLFDKDKTKLINYPIGKSNTSYTVPDTVSLIESYSFSHCTHVTAVSLPNSVQSVNQYAFSDCTALSSIDIPNSVTAFGKGAFKDCSSLASIIIPNSISFIDDETFSGCTNLVSVSIPSSVTAIGDEAFNRCVSLQTVSLPNSVVSIGNCAYQRCDSLTSVFIPDSVTTLGHSIFYGCRSLTSVTISNLIDSIPTSTFAGCSELISFAIPDGVTQIKDSAFEGCTKLASVIIPSSVSQIGLYVFRGCASLQSIILPKDVIIYGNNVQYQTIPKTTVIFKQVGNQYTIESGTGQVIFESEYLDEVRSNALVNPLITMFVSFPTKGTILFDNEAVKVLTPQETTLSFIEKRLAEMDESEKAVWGGDFTGFAYYVTFGNVVDYEEGTLTISVPYSSIGLDPDKFYICDSSEMTKEKIQCSYDGENVSFSTKHLSTFAVMYVNASGSSGMCSMVIAAAIAMICSGVAVPFITRFRL